MLTPGEPGFTALGLSASHQNVITAYKRSFQIKLAPLRLGGTARSEKRRGAAVPPRRRGFCGAAGGHTPCNTRFGDGGPRESRGRLSAPAGCIFQRRRREGENAGCVARARDAGRWCIENILWTDVESTPHPPPVCVRKCPLLPHSPWMYIMLRSRLEGLILMPFLPIHPESNGSDLASMACSPIPSSHIHPEGSSMSYSDLGTSACSQCPSCLVVWIAFCLSHAAAKAVHHNLAGFAVALEWDALQHLAGWSLRISTRPTLNRGTEAEAALLYEHSP
jgi:hypothetical protein